MCGSLETKEILWRNLVFWSATFFPKLLQPMLPKHVTKKTEYYLWKNPFRRLSFIKNYQNSHLYLKTQTTRVSQPALLNLWNVLCSKSDQNPYHELSFFCKGIIHQHCCFWLILFFKKKKRGKVCFLPHVLCSHLKLHRRNRLHPDLRSLIEAIHLRWPFLLNRLLQSLYFPPCPCPSAEHPHCYNPFLQSSFPSFLT